MIYYTWVVYPTINAHGPDRFPPLLFPLLSMHIVFARFLLFLISSLHKILFAYIWVRTLCDTFNSILYVLYFSRHYLFLSFIVLRFCFCRNCQVTTSLYKIGAFLSLLTGKPFPNHATMAWFYYTKKERAYSPPFLLHSAFCSIYSFAVRKASLHFK